MTMTIYESHPYWTYDWYENIGLSDDLNRPFEADLDGFDGLILPSGYD